MKKLILKRLKCYTADNTDLAVRILNIYHEDDEGIEVMLTLFEKKCNWVYERSKKYKLKWENIQHWRLLK